MPVSKFRENAGVCMDWVDLQGGMIWLTRHGKHVAALVPFYQVKVLEDLMGCSQAEKVRQLEAEYAKFRSAKAVQAAEERARMAEGKGVGGEYVTSVREKMAARGSDPWEDDPVLIMPSARLKPRWE